MVSRPHVRHLFELFDTAGQTANAYFGPMGVDGPVQAQLSLRLILLTGI